ncbi:MAG TPA: YigZ family protein [Bacillota bacterium]|nr:YigZ family protein [Bacillota bacterium]
MKLYKTVAGEASARQTIEKSRFIARIKPVSSKKEADDFIEGIRKKNKDATHNVPAMVLGDKFQIQWASDDGEPQGTSGAPILYMLIREGITNVVVVVTRYFGGIKLGTGGLVRAYTGTVKLAIERASVREISEMAEMTVKIDYTFLAGLKNAAEAEDFSIENIEYKEKITVVLIVPSEKKEKIKKLVAGITSGSAKVVSERLIKC